MMIFGITGSIATGKSTVAGQFAQMGVKTHEADHAVHALLAEGGRGVEPVARIFPEVKKGNAIDRIELGKIVFADEKKLRALEAILHPLVKQEEERFARRLRREGKKMLLLNIPLLFETRADRRMNKTITVTAPAFLQKARALARPGMTEEKLAQILAQQMPQQLKCVKSDFVIHTGLGRAYSFRQSKALLVKLSRKKEKPLKQGRKSRRKNHAGNRPGH
jgi:dephospho-CoA kinase